MFLKSSDGVFGGVDVMVMRWDQLDGHLVGSDVFLDHFGAFVVHDVQHWLVVLSPQNIEDLGDGSNEGGIGAGSHWADNDGIEVIYVGNEDVLHVLE